MQPTRLAIVTEFVPRGSLFRLLHRSQTEVDAKRRLTMAMDVARGEFQQPLLCTDPNVAQHDRTQSWFQV